MDLKIVIFKLTNIYMGAKFGKIYKYGPKNHHFRIIKLGYVSEASAAHPYQTSGKLTTPPSHPTPDENINFAEISTALPPRLFATDEFSAIFFSLSNYYHEVEQKEWYLLIREQMSRDMTKPTK